MDEAVVMAVVAWLWGLSGLTALVLIGYLASDLSDENEFATYGIASVGAICGIASVVFALHILGYPRVAIWAWRVPAAAYLPVAVYMVTKVGAAVKARLGAILNIVIALLLSIASFLVRQIFVPRPADAPAAPVKFPSITFSGVHVWHGIALGVLGFGTLLFLVLFIRMIERGVAPQIETQWGGIGGGMGGWRVSASLTYLAATVVFGVLFAFFIIQLKA